MTGLPLKLGPGKRSPWSPSIDRIDPRFGYTPGNCRIVCWLYNAAKSEFTDDDVLVMASAVVTEERIADLVRRTMEAA